MVPGTHQVFLFRDFPVQTVEVLAHDGITIVSVDWATRTAACKQIDNDSNELGFNRE
jgi:hypothetical protein